MADRYRCVGCLKVVAPTANKRYRTHNDADGNKCGMSSEVIPDFELEAGPMPTGVPADVPMEGRDFNQCPECGRAVKLTRLGYYEPHDATLRGGNRCPVSGTRMRRSVTDVPLPGDGEAPSAKPSNPDSLHRETPTSTALTSESASAGSSPKELPRAAGPEAVEASSPESSSTPPNSEEPASTPSPGGAFSLGVRWSDQFLQPGSPFLQPFDVPPRISLKESMSDRGKELAARLRETFYAYTNRNTKDNRSAQTTLGPSEAGSPCDRQIAMKLLNITPVNPQEGWAPFVGTAVHAELARMFEWANGSGSGRYVTEMRVNFGSKSVPYGTLDLLDRVLYMVDDHKLMGRWSLDQLVQKGPSQTYRIQLQIYGLGAELAGEKVREVALIGWPRQESSLDKLYVHVEPYDRKVAEAAIARVEAIAERVKRESEPLHPDGAWSAARPMEVAQGFEVGNDCKWCPFYLKGDKDMTRGCPGK